MRTTDKSVKKVYLCGGITGRENYKTIFRWAAVDLTRQGYVVLNPAVLPLGLDEPDYMRIDLSMVDTADAVALLPEWEKSKGAKAEVAICERTGKRCETISRFVDYPQWDFPVLRVNQSEKPWRFVPWAAVAKHRSQAFWNHSQTVEQLAKKGGLSWKEIYYILNDSDYKHEEDMDFQSLVLSILADEYKDEV